MSAAPLIPDASHVRRAQAIIGASAMSATLKYTGEPSGTAAPAATWSSISRTPARS